VAVAVVIAAIVVVIIILIATSGDDGSGHVATGPAVEALQKDLKTLGHYDGPINGEYDEATQEAVKKLQTANGLPADGRLTPQTIAAIQSALGEQESQTIKAFQTTLSELGWYTGPIDGAYGPVTAQAVAGLQGQLGVTPDGILGPETFAAFESQCQPNPSPCKRPATPATTVPATAGGTQAPTSPSPTTAASSTTTSQATTTSTSTTASTTTSTG
jgi:peptidoglycan hydrolase-like protein with peptidoglycan-binding domain